jgi:hypothetical protein
MSVQSAPFEILGRFSVSETWDGSPLVLLVNQNVNMPQTPDGSMVFAYQNVSSQNNQGSIAVTSGGGSPVTKYAYAFENRPNIWINNWQANNLSITNVSANNNTPIRIQAVGPGMPGTNPLTLPIGSPLPLAPGQTAQTNALPQYMQLVFQCATGQLATFVLIGGTLDSSGNNAYVISVNAPSSSGPPGGGTPPAGYYATTINNSYILTFNWGSSLVFVANMSGLTSTGAEVTLRQL